MPSPIAIPTPTSERKAAPSNMEPLAPTTIVWCGRQVQIVPVQKVQHPYYGTLWMVRWPNGSTRLITHDRLYLKRQAYRHMERRQ